MSSNKGRTNNVFGRDEFNALLGGSDGLSEVLTRRTVSTTASSTVGKGNHHHHGGIHKDISDMTVEETAALLKQQQQQKSQSHTNAKAGSLQQQPRLRATSSRPREYHKLFEEEQQQRQQQAQQPFIQPLSTATTTKANDISNTTTMNQPTEDKKNDNEDFRTNTIPHTIEPVVITKRRQKAAPVILVELGTTDQDPSNEKKPLCHDTVTNRHDDTDDSDDSTNHNLSQTLHRGRQRQSSDDDDDDDDDDNSSIDRRRQRALQKRKEQAVLRVDTSTTSGHVVHDNNTERNHTGDDLQHSNPQQPSTKSLVNDVRIENQSTNDLSVTTGTRQQHKAASNVESSSDSSTSSSSSTEDDSESASDDDDGIVKPIFIPKHRRTMIQSIEDERVQQLEKEQQEKEFKERRKKESRALLQQTLLNAKLDRSNTNTDNLIDGITGALNEIPTDNDDDDDPNLQYEAWEVRELERIIVEWEVQVEKERNEEEQNQRRRRYASRDHWDNDEVDASSPTSQRTDTMHQHGPSKTLAPHGGTGYHHRGAFFMEDTEGNEIRQKAMEYHTVDPSNQRTTAVYHDHQHRDRTQLPKVMQVKKFGFANQSKYRGLAAEDTTDKNMDILPIVHNKNRSKRL